MNNLNFFSKYSSDQDMRERLYPLFDAVFGIPVDVLRDFYARGFWNPSYQPYTLFDGERAVANASMFDMPLVINGTQIHAAGIQSVMTHPEYRGLGLMKQVFGKMLEEIDEQYEITILMTENPALYTPYGFRTVQEHYFTAAAPDEASVEAAVQEHRSLLHNGLSTNQYARKLEFFEQNDLRIVRECFDGHQPLSKRFAPVSHQPSFALNMYNPYYQAKLYFSEDYNSLLIFDVDGDTLRLFDVIGRKLPAIEQICSQIEEPFSQIQFYFEPDALGVRAYETVPYESGSHLMVRGRFDVEGQPFKLPITAAF
ncbi:GNAT family N-acetyltransferase [Brevibacillus dissolubilis]|uniref:GNAT family N-acetyltransferase n=1 Tax=Brevibacillus dissolubilis TaxID=1844116 RepID=UPI0011178BF6|nr:GNAT family N-acetyltransferase [Brevibacillus dissolubilis]